MATLAILGKLVTLVLEVNQGPILTIALQDDAATLAAIAAIVLSVIGKNKERNFKIARLVATGSLIVGMANAFMF